MDIIAIIKEYMPDGMELGEKAIAAMVKAIKLDIGKEFVTNEQYSIKTKLVTDYESQISELQARGADYDAIKSALDDERTAHNATRAEYAAEKTAAEVDGLLTEILKSAGMNAAAIPKAIKLCDRAIIERDKEGAIKNADKVLDRFKDEWKDFFGEVQQKGADVGTSSNVSMQKNPWLKDHRNLAEQTRIYRENPALAVQMAAAAGITIN